jgi:light-regulated signal transduction histidine kinase (bacteriophytochrome)
LKEPVRTINSFSKILVKKYEQTMPPDGKSLLNLITSSSNRLGKMIQDLLSYATMDKNLLKASEVKLNDVVEIVKSQLQAAINENEVVLNCNNLGIVKGHQTLMIQLFQNIISNAIKFKTSKESPIINIASEKMGDFYQISIEDNGIGIAENHIDHIFGVFNKLHAPTEYSGSGIGLATCKKIVDIYEGKIWATSELGKGTMFYFTLPAFTN